MTFNFNMRTVLMISVALIAAALTALFARGWLNAQRVSAGPAQYAYQILVAKADLPAGSFVKAQDLRWQGWPKGDLAPTYILQGKGRKPENFDGAVVRRGLVTGQPITDAQVVRPGEQGFLAAVLEPGTRAASIQVNAITGISGFVIPGDRVDMVLTHTVRSEEGKRSRHISETVMQDIRVIAVDQKTDDQKGKAAVAKTVTLQVTPKEVEKLGIINKLGVISLSLRPIAREAASAAVPTAATVPAAVKPVKAAAAPTNGLAPISTAQAAESPITILPPPNAADSSAPVPLFSAATTRAAAGLDSGATTDKAGVVDAAEVKAEVEAKELAAAPIVPVHRPVRLPRGARAGATMDSEVSRFLGRTGSKSGRSVQVVRGASAQEQKF
jgi:pilus assembly protein CpaB